MAKIYFLFGVHNHQPVGNFPHIFQQAYKECYAPFINILKKYPTVKCNIHISGPLYDWFLQNHKSFVVQLKRLVARGQIEIMSGGYYEPILPLIPDEDKLSQIKMMNHFVKKHFGTHPRGAWLAERVWEPNLPRVLSMAGIKYTFLDDTHFRYAGLNEKEFFGYYVTEDSFKPLYIFPISKTLRYKIPFSKTQEAFDLLKSFHNPEEDTLVTLFDDGEKFGLWPHTFEWVYTKGWLDGFFSLLAQNAGIVETITAQAAIDKFKPQGLVYLPTASYDEMGEWVLEPGSSTIYESLLECIKGSNHNQTYKNFIQGGFFRNFYRKYPRLNFMHKRMFYVSEKINKKTTPQKDKRMFDLLWKAQCNCGYWHGIFGGFYLGHIRSAIYENLIQSENEFDKKYQRSELQIEKCDLELTGEENIILKNKKMACVFSSRGGTLLELSLRNKPFNFLNTVTRREESYHSKIQNSVQEDTKEVATIHDVTKSKDKDLDTYLIYDRYEKTALIDHLLHRGISPDDFYEQRNFRSLSSNIYSCADKKAKENIVLRYHYQEQDLAFDKQIVFGKDALIKVDYAFHDNVALKTYDFGVEFNLFLQSPDDIAINNKKFSLQKREVFAKTTSLVIKDYYKKVKIKFDFSVADVFLVPLYSVSSSESGFEKVYQQITVLVVNKRNKDSFGLSCALRKEA
jgi:alpha-amylase